MKGPEEGAAGRHPEAMPMNPDPLDMNRWTILDDFEVLYQEARHLAAAILKKGGHAR